MPRVPLQFCSGQWATFSIGKAVPHPRQLRGLSCMAAKCRTVHNDNRGWQNDPLLPKSQNWQPSRLFPLPGLDSLSAPPLQYLYYPSLTPSQTPQLLPWTGAHYFSIGPECTLNLSPISPRLIHPLLSCSRGSLTCTSDSCLVPCHPITFWIMLKLTAASMAPYNLVLTCFTSLITYFPTSSLWSFQPPAPSNCFLFYSNLLGLNFRTIPKIK